MTQENIIKSFEPLFHKSDDYNGILFMNMFRVLPKCYKLYFDNSKILRYLKSDDPYEDIKAHSKYRLDMRKTMRNFENDSKFTIFCYSSNEYIIVYNNGLSSTDTFSCCFLINFTITDLNDASELYENIYTNNIDQAFKLISKLFVIAKKEQRIEFGIAAIDPSNSIYTSWYEYPRKCINIKKNYNDDLPYKEMCNVIENDSSSLMIFYGEPGTGKSSLIKHFISTYDAKDFIFMDGDLLYNASKEKLMTYFLECQDTVFILEDCEKALLDRDHNFNPVMSLLLNLTDGIIGDVLNIKLICTFNTSLSNIDKALLRKGRLSLKYEFKKLTKEKCRILTNDDTIDKDMTLADLYNKDEENDFSKKNQKKVGF